MAQIKLNATYGLTGTLPAVSGANLTTLNATNISSGTLNAARYSATYGVDVADHYYLASSTSGGTAGTVADSNGAGGGAWTKHHAQFSDTTSVTTGSGGGVFSFPKIGFYMILGSLSFYNDTADNDWSWYIEYTNNDFSSHTDIGWSRVSVQGSPNNYIQNANHYMLDVTNITNDKFRLELGSVASGNYVYGTNAKLSTTLQIYRMGDT